MTNNQEKYQREHQLVDAVVNEYQSEFEAKYLALQINALKENIETATKRIDNLALFIKATDNKINKIRKEISDAEQQQINFLPSIASGSAGPEFLKNQLKQKKFMLRLLAKEKQSLFKEHRRQEVHLSKLKKELDEKEKLNLGSWKDKTIQELLEENPTQNTIQPITPEQELLELITKREEIPNSVEAHNQQILHNTSQDNAENINIRHLQERLKSLKPYSLPDPHSEDYKYKQNVNNSVLKILYDLLLILGEEEPDTHTEKPDTHTEKPGFIEKSNLSAIRKNSGLNLSRR